MKLNFSHKYRIKISLNINHVQYIYIFFFDDLPCHKLVIIFLTANPFDSSNICWALQNLQ